MISRTPVTSKMISGLGWSGGVMAVQFNNGAVYHYEGVPQDIFEGVLNADSIGQAFNELIKSNYRAKRVE